jgi:hypothetical protein
VQELSPLGLLIKLLAVPDIKLWNNFAVVAAMSWLDKSQLNDKKCRTEYTDISQRWPSNYQDNIRALAGMSSIVVRDDNAFKLSTLQTLNKEMIEELKSDSVALTVLYDAFDVNADEARSGWQRLLQYLNIGQFLPYFFASTEKGLDDGHYAKLDWDFEDGNLATSEWDDIRTLADDEVADLLNLLAKEQCSLPEVGYELFEGDEAIAEAELAWPEKQIVVLMDYQVSEFEQIFLGKQWSVFSNAQPWEEIVKMTRE